MFEKLEKAFPEREASFSLSETFPFYSPKKYPSPFDIFVLLEGSCFEGSIYVKQNNQKV